MFADLFPGEIRAKEAIGFGDVELYRFLPNWNWIDVNGAYGQLTIAQFHHKLGGPIQGGKYTLRIYPPLKAIR